MIRGCIAAFAFLMSFNAAANEKTAFYQCNWCTTRSDFIYVAESNGKSLPVINEAEYTIVVANDVDEVLYTGILLVANWNGTTHTNAFLGLASPELHAAYTDFKRFKALSDDRKLVVVMPPSTWWSDGGGLSFKYRNRERAGLAIFNSDGYEDYVGEHFVSPQDNLIQIIWKGYFTNVMHDFPEVIVLYKNGDVAKFSITAPSEAPFGAFEYVEGSARDRLGNPLPDGSGTVTGGSYVGPMPNGGVKIRPGNDEDVWLVCSRVGGGPWSCYIQEESE